MPHVKRQKIQLQSKVIMTALLLVSGLFAVTKTSQAVVGFQVGTSTLILNNGENLMYGNINASSNAGSNLLLLQNASLPKFIITSAGNVGVGISNPNDIFSIGNSGTAPAGSDKTGHNYASTYLSTDNYALVNYGLVKSLIDSATSSSALWGGTVTGSIWSLNGTNNVGIGTSTPGSKLHVSGGSVLIDNNYGYYIKRTDGNSIAAMTINSSDLTIYNGAHSTAAALLFQWRNSGTTPLMTIMGQGNVGIGTTNPGTKLSIEKALSATETQKTDVGSHGIVINSASYVNDNYFPGITWNTGTVADGKPKMGIWGRTSGIGTSMYLGTSAVYATGITNTAITINPAGNVGIGTTAPNDIFSIGNSGSAPAGSDKTGHNFTSTYLSSDDYALTNYGVVKSLIGSATGTILSLWSGTKNGNIWNGDAGAGNVGIGTTNPGSKLDIWDGTSAYINVGSNNNAGLILTGYNTSPNPSFKVRSALGTNSAPLALTNGKYLGYFQFDGYNGSAFSSAASLSAVAVGDWSQAGAKDTRMDFGVMNNAGTGIVTALSVLTGGNVGIGTTAPNYKLDINGITAVRNVLSVSSITSGNTGADTSTGLLTINTNNSAAFGVWNRAYSTAYLLVKDGNVGIGTTAPAAKLDVTGNLRLSTSDFSDKIYWGASSAYELGYRSWKSNSSSGLELDATNAAGSGLLFKIASIEKMRINNQGNVGIGTTIPNDIFSIGNSGSAPAGSSNTGHNFTATYLDSDNYALANVGYVKSLISAATSTMSTTTMVTSIFLTATTSAGNLTYTGGYTGYDAGNKICNAAQAGSHFCRTDEIVYLIQINGAAGFSSINGQDAWIADGPPGFTGAVSADDCGGWTDATNNKLGHFWMYASTGGGRGSLSSCDTIKKITCCK